MKGRYKAKERCVDGRGSKEWEGIGKVVGVKKGRIGKRETLRGVK